MNKHFYILFFAVLLTVSCMNEKEDETKLQNDVVQNDSVLISNDSINFSNPELIYFKQNECIIDCELEEQIIDNYYKHDTLFIKIASIQDCSAKHSVEIESYKDEILNFKVINKTGSFADCYCLYFFDIIVGNIQTKAEQITINGKKADSKRTDNNQIIDNLEPTAVFPGGNDTLLTFIYNNQIYPDSSFLSNIEGTVYIECIIDSFGIITESKILRSINNELDSEAIRIVTIMPKWIPAKNHKNEKIVSKVIIPIKFKIK